MYLLKHFAETKKKGLNLSFHVRFCNDNIRRNWATNIEKYFGKDELLAKHSKSIVSYCEIYIFRKSFYFKHT